MISYDDYHNGIVIYENGNVKDELLRGEVYIDANSKCEGFVEDPNNQTYFIFGKFNKFNKFELYTINEAGSIIKYEAKKTMFRYNGTCTIIGDNLHNMEIPISVKVMNYDVDPRDYEVTPKMELIEKINKYKEIWLQDDINKYIYDRYMGTLFEENKEYSKKWVV